MSLKQTLGLGIFLVGVGLIIFAAHAFHEINQAKGFIHNASDFFTKNPMWNPIVKFFGGTALEKASEHDTSAAACLTAGIILTIAGAVIFIVSKTRKAIK